MIDEYILLSLFFTICILGASHWFRRYRTTRRFTAGPGLYTIGRNIPSGKYDLVADEGEGNICLLRRRSLEWEQVNNLGLKSDSKPRRFRNIDLYRGDRLEINGSLTIAAIPPSPIRSLATEPVEPGDYLIGADLMPGTYNLEALLGEGQVYIREKGSDDHAFFQEMAKDKKKDGKAASFENLTCNKDAVLSVRGNLKLQFTPVPKPNFWRRLFQ